MEIYSMFLGRKNKYCENDYTTKCNLQIQCDPYQITNGIFHRTRMKTFTIYVETQKTSNSQSSLEKEEWSWRSLASWLQALLQSSSHQATSHAVLLPKPNFHRTGWGGGAWGTYKRRSQRALALFLSLFSMCAYALSLSPPLSLPLSPYPAPHNGALFSSRLWVDVPSCLKDGFSCYYLNKIEL